MSRLVWMIEMRFDLCHCASSLRADVTDKHAMKSENPFFSHVRPIRDELRRQGKTRTKASLPILLAPSALFSSEMDQDEAEDRERETEKLNSFFLRSTMDDSSAGRERL